jgi:bacteriorhodopsin
MTPTDWFWLLFGMMAAGFMWWRFFAKDRRPGERLVAGTLAGIYTVGSLIGIWVLFFRR